MVYFVSLKRDGWRVVVASRLSSRQLKPRGMGIDWFVAVALEIDARLASGGKAIG